MKALVLSIVGKDRTGLVAEVADAIASCDGNWNKSSFCQLSGQFAGFVEISFPEQNHDMLVARCNHIAGISISLHEAINEELEMQESASITVTGNDRKGIVSDISATLKNMQINIQEINTSCETSANWGIPIFTASINIKSTKKIDTDEIKQQIESIADDLMVDLPAQE